MWLLSINFVSDEISDLNISFCTAFLTSKATSIIKTFEMYKDNPLIEKAKIIAIGIKYIKD